MYALANRITPADLEVLATQLFVEMLKSGYTSVAEFHYLHRQTNGDLYAGSNALWDAIDAAAEAAGIGLTFLPTLYQTSDFGRQPLETRASPFRTRYEWFVRAVEERLSAERRSASPVRRTGAAFHSLRAVPLESLQEALRDLRSVDAELPVHIHVAEQLKEVEACKLAHRPTAHRIAVGHRVARQKLVPGACNPRHGCGAARHRRNGGRRLRIHQYRGEFGRWFFRGRSILETRRPNLRGLRQPGNRLPGRGAALDGVPATACAKSTAGVLADKAEPHVGTRLVARCGTSRRAGHRPTGGGDRARAAARIGWYSIATHPAFAGATAGNRARSLGVRGRQRGDSRCHGGRPVGGQGRAACR